jgi:hypothetical protein
LVEFFSLNPDATKARWSLSSVPLIPVGLLMKRYALLLPLLLEAMPAFGGPETLGTITTRTGKSFFECKITRIHLGGVGFTHRDGAAKIAI